MTMKLQLVDGNDPILTKPSIPFDFSNPPVDPEELANEMLTTMALNNGLGLAANQVGLPWSVFAVQGDPYVCFNPKIVDASDTIIALEEGCLSFPSLYVNVKRPDAIRLRYQDFKGVVHTSKYGGLTCRCILHEMEHLEGKLFFNNVSKYHRDKAFRLYKLYQRHPERFTKKV